MNSCRWLGRMIIRPYIVALLHCLIVPLVYGATHYVDDGVSYYIDWTGGAWGSIPQPSAEWRLADAIDYDTTGAGVYRNYGDSTLATGLTDAVRPGLAEGILSEGQTALSFDGVNDYLYINNSNVLDVNKEDFSVAIWAYKISGNSAIGAAEKRSTSGWHMRCANSSFTWYFQINDHNSHTVTVSHNPDIGFYNWHFVVGTFDYSDSKKARLYYKGDLKSTSYNAAFDSLDNNGNFRVGREGSNEFKGGIALFQFWKGTCLSDNQVDSLYNAMKPAGTISLPYPSFQSAVYQASASDTIYGLAGRYRETLEIADGLVNRLGERSIVRLDAQAAAEEKSVEGVLLVRGGIGVPGGSPHSVGEEVPKAGEKLVILFQPGQGVDGEE